MNNKIGLYIQNSMLRFTINSLKRILNTIIYYIVVFVWNISNYIKNKTHVTNNLVLMETIEYNTILYHRYYYIHNDKTFYTTFITKNDESLESLDFNITNFIKNRDIILAAFLYDDSAPVLDVTSRLREFASNFDTGLYDWKNVLQYLINTSDDNDTYIYTKLGIIMNDNELHEIFINVDSNDAMHFALFRKKCCQKQERCYQKRENV